MCFEPEFEGLKSHDMSKTLLCAHGMFQTQNSDLRCASHVRKSEFGHVICFLTDSNFMVVPPLANSQHRRALLSISPQFSIASVHFKVF